MKSARLSVKLFIGVLIGLVALLGAVWMVIRQAGMPTPSLLPKNGSVGVYGPVGLVFQDLPRDESLENKLALFTLDGSLVMNTHLEWEGKTVWLRPEHPLVAGQVYELRLEAGVVSRGGLTLRETARWRIGARPPEVAYLGNVEAPEVWVRGMSAAPARQLTFTGGTVYDFAVSPSGDRLAFASENERFGLDLWETTRDGGEPRLLLDCASDRCASPLYSPDEKQLVYTRSQATGIGTYISPVIWTLNLQSLDTRVLVDQPGSAVGGMAWSPDGIWLSFYDSGASGVNEGSIRMVNVVDETGFAVPANSGSGGSWSPDSRSLWFVRSTVSGEEAQSGLYAAVIDSMAVHPVAWGFLDLARFGTPVWSGDGNWIAFSAASPDTGVGSLLWRADPTGESLLALTHEPFYRYGSYSWDPGSTNLVFQRLEQSSSLSRPQVAVWVAERNEVTVIADDAALPRWMP